ncbi:hypothetical protein GCM10027271_27440 [Saccharopolyspora gloriosae]|uniref:Uncharacterized protein n=1 Tax=Saccharopolyspora gloriosae TaxID=455344 RepID=A0A840NTA2_9PSEU|nr:hypothetical protein [Saccharopolyspora gloriosae]MBB5071417.1 hypothetical protein [Saccharopolyspora gloriosae]
MSQPYGPQPGQPHPQAGQPVPPPDWSGAQQNPASGPFPQPYSGPPPQPYQGSGLPQPSYPAPEPAAQQPHPGSGPMPQPYAGSPYPGPMAQPYPGSGPMPQQPYPGSGPMPQQPYPGSGPMAQQPYPGSGPMPQQPYPQPGQPMPQGYPPPGPPQQAPGMPQPLGPPPAGMGRVVLDSSYTPLAFMLALFKPGVTINGQPGPPAVWGRTVIDLPPGQHQIEVHVNYLWKFGSATAVIPVNAGQQIEAYYKPPMVAFGAGAIGPVPQSTPNVRLVVGLMIAWFVLCLLIFSLPMMLS